MKEVESTAESGDSENSENFNVTGRLLILSSHGTQKYIDKYFQASKWFLKLICVQKLFNYIKNSFKHADVHSTLVIKRETY